jgi:predicted phosphohydrolase
MALYAMADLHLALSIPEKTMAVFDGWHDYMELIRENWLKIVREEDLVVLPGDISWAMKLEETEADFGFIDALPGRKVLIKGNHDLWWSTRKKIEDFLKAKGFDSISIVFNDHYVYDEKYAVCGTRGWVDMPGESNNELVQKREAQRLDTSIKSAEAAGLEPLVFLHYPPVYASSTNPDILEVLKAHSIKRCWYGHIHGKKGHRAAFQGEYEGISFTMISGDYLHFFPYRIL